MTGKRKTDKSKSSGERKTRKLRVEKETLKDLDAARGKGAKGGGVILASTACRGETLGCGGAGTGTIGCVAMPLRGRGGFLSGKCQ